MSELSLRPRSATELVDAAFQVFRREPVQFVVAAALAYVPLTVIQLVGAPLASGEQPAAIASAISGIASIIVYALVGGVTTLLTRDVYFDRPIDLMGAYRTVGRKLVPLIATSVIAFLLIMIGAVFLLVPGLYLFARLFAVRQAIVVEDKGIDGALSRSWDLSDGNKLHILATFGLALLVTLAFTLGAGFLAGVIHSRVLMIVISTALSVITYPFLSIAETLLYYDARIRNEGFDVEYLAGLAAPVDPAAGTAP